MNKLAIHGGAPVRTKPFTPYNSLGKREEEAVGEVIRSGVLSDFIGADGPFFLGGRKVQELEALWTEHCDTKYAVAMNSATSVIIAALGAFGVGPGDEVIVTPYSHVISATAPLLYNAIPVFADSEPDTFCMSVESIERCITPRTKAIIVVDLFGQSADMDGIMDLARRHKLWVLSDSAHITIATHKGKRAGALGHIGSYSLNSHKTIQSGEGGIAVTDDDELALRMRLIRNHAENCVASMGVQNLVNMLGFNFRMTELEAAVAVEQTKRAEELVLPRRTLCEHLTRRLDGVPGLTVPKVREGCTHDYLLYVLRYDADVVGMPRAEFMRCLDAEGIGMSAIEGRHVPPVGTFVKPIHLQPIFQERTMYARGCPWSCEHARGSTVSYERGITPVVEDLWANSLIAINAVYPPLTIADMDDIADAFIKVAAAGRG